MPFIIACLIVFMKAGLLMLTAGGWGLTTTISLVSVGRGAGAFDGIEEVRAFVLSVVTAGMAG